MSTRLLRFTHRFHLIPAAVLAMLLIATSHFSGQTPASPLTNPFGAGWLVADTNGDGIVDYVPGKIVVPERPSAVENSAAADLAARVGFATTGFTPPMVIDAAVDKSDGPRIYVGGSAAPAKDRAAIEEIWKGLAEKEGGVFEIDGNLAVLGHDDDGLLAAAEQFAARAPYVSRMNGATLSTLGDIVGVTYLKGFAGVHRAMLRDKSVKTLPAGSPIPAAVAGTGGGGANADGNAADAAAGDAAGEAAGRLDLATIYTMRGLFRGSARMPVPSNLDGQLYVPAGAAGIAMANLAARMGMETTGIAIPLATPDPNATAREIRTKSVIAEASAIGKEAASKLREEDSAAAQSEASLKAGEGELRVVDRAFGRQPAILVRGDESGEASAIDLAANHLPNLWEPGKQSLSIEEIRYDLHRFFSLRSSAGQAAAALYRLDKWSEQVQNARNVEARVFVDVADPGLKDVIRGELEKRLGVSEVRVETGSLHAGTQCCDKLPALHYREPGYTFHQGVPKFVEDIAIPWEGTRLISAIKSALPKLQAAKPVSVVARVSEGPEV
ncbi:MAG TPA: hypothetical protein VKS01_08435, partial [Bryobacteraceae bacterium]|nr:hypothetical protein [Bryobacteraceae bacterium]